MTKSKTVEVIEEVYEDEPTSVREYRGYIMRRFDPFGFILISSGKPGDKPEDLSGQFTDFTMAERSIDSYLNKKELINKAKVA